MSSTLHVNACDSIEIRAIQEIQGYGALLAVHNETAQIHYVSENISSVIGKEPNALLGTQIDEHGDTPQLTAVATHMHTDNTQRIFPWEPSFINETWECCVHRQEEYTLFEWVFFRETHDSTIDAPHFAALTAQARSTNSLETALQSICLKMQQHMGYDKVLLYHFQNDGSGLVVAEAMTEGMTPYLNLHFPTTDVPNPVRKMYQEFPLRVIHDCKAPQSQIQSMEGLRALDLSSCLIRGVAPVHIQYTQNMQITTSMSHGIIVEGVLWGLLCCHHKTPKEIPYVDRLQVSMYAQVMEHLIIEHEKSHQEKNSQEERDFFANLEGMVAEPDPPYVDVIYNNKDDILRMFGATGLCLLYEGKMHASGIIPTADQLNGLIAGISARKEASGLIREHNLREHFPQADDFKEVASGILGFQIGNNPEEVFLLFRPEKCETIEWAGNPHHNPADTSNGELTPRASFRIWREESRGQSHPWTDHECEMMQALEKNVHGNILQQLVNKRLFSDAQILQITLAVENANEGIFILNDTWTVVWHNQKFTTLLHLPAPVTGHNFTAVMQLCGLNSAEMEREIAGHQEKWQHDIEITAESTQLIRLKISPFYNDILQEQQYIGLATDISSVKEAQDANEALQKQKDEFIRIASHDLRNPLSNILATASLLQDLVTDSEEIQKLVQMILRQGQSMQGFLEDLLNVTVIRAGQLQIHEETFSLKEFCTQLVEDTRPLAAKKEIALSLKLLFEDLTLTTDKSKLQQIITNFVSNGIKYSHPKTTITITGSIIDTNFHIAVQDQGLGIPPEEHEKVFGQHQQLSPRPTGTETSNGLGLYICKKLAEILQGNVGFSSTPGKGSTFFVTLPIQRMHQASPTEEKQP